MIFKELNRLAGKFEELIKTAFTKNELLHLIHKGGNFGIMSAYHSGDTSRSKNKVRHQQLTDLIEDLGYHYYPYKGTWDEEKSDGTKKVYSEKSILIPDIDPGLLFDLGRKFEQAAVIYKGDDVIGLYSLVNKTVSVAIDTAGDPAYAYDFSKTYHSRSRGLSFDFKFVENKDLPWDGHHPVTKKEIFQLLSDGFFF